MAALLTEQNPRLSFLTPTRKFRILSILLTVYHHPAVSQHKIARSTSLSSAMVNTYIKELATGGLITLTSRNNRDLNYSLTASGKESLAALLADYSAEIVQLYTQAKNEIVQRLAAFLKPGQKTRLILFGASETCELVLRALENFPQAEVVGVVDSNTAKQNTVFHGHLISAPQRIRELAPDSVIITSFAKQDEIFDSIRSLENEGIAIQKLATI